MQSKIIHADGGIIILINNDQYTRLSVFKLPRVYFFFFCKTETRTVQRKALSVDLQQFLSSALRRRVPR
jgi:hypothetical protein